jgi:hypothetical protein
MTLYAWPRAAAFGRVIPKSKIHEHAGANTTLKDLFVREIEQIVWTHKLAPETINLPATKSVTEIQVFRIDQKVPALNLDALRAIDRAIPFPIIFELAHAGSLKLVAAYKRTNEADATRWVLSDYYQGEWRPEDSVRAPLPLALNLGTLYEQLLSPLIDSATAQAGKVAHSPAAAYAVDAEQPLSIQARIEHAEAVKAKAKQVEQIKARLAREKQFNKRVAINAELRIAKDELSKLSGGNHGKAG